MSWGKVFPMPWPIPGILLLYIVSIQLTGIVRLIVGTIRGIWEIAVRKGVISVEREEPTASPGSRRSLLIIGQKRDVRE
jgi:hypothetical protein